MRGEEGEEGVEYCLGGRRGIQRAKGNYVFVILL
jgi:hypothetical protein